MKRREFIKISTLTGIAINLPFSIFAENDKLPLNELKPNEKGEFVLPKLPYDYKALEPHFDAQTMEIHHSKHHAAYVKGLNNLVIKYESIANLSLEKIFSQLSNYPKELVIGIKNQGGGHWNHDFFWKILTPKSNFPSTNLLKKLEKQFGTLETFKEQFQAASLSVFGSGWCWLVYDKKEFKIVTTPNQENPLMNSQKPILGLDVWEHAYYLKYQNKRVDYIKSFWNVLNWDEVEKNLNN